MDNQLQVAQQANTNLPEGRVRDLDTPELAQRFADSREWLFARYQELYASPDYIPVVRTAYAGKTELRQDAIGREIFSVLRHQHLEGNSNYNCQTCRQAFETLYPVWFMDKNGKGISPLVELLEKHELIPMVRRSIEERVDIQYNPLESISFGTTRATWGTTTPEEIKQVFNHYYGFTTAQVTEISELGRVDQHNAKSICDILNLLDGGLKPLDIKAKMGTLVGDVSALGGLEHLQKFYDVIKDIKSSEIRLLWVSHMLRLSEWGPLKHFKETIADMVMHAFHNNHEISDIVDMYLKKTDPAKFKQRQAEASGQLVKQLRDQLVANDALSIVRRRVAIVGVDMASEWTSSKYVPKDQRAAQAAVVDAIENPPKDTLSVFDRMITDRSNDAKKAQENELSKEMRDLYMDSCLASPREMQMRHVQQVSILGFIRRLKECNAKRVGLRDTEFCASLASIYTTEVDPAPGAMKIFTNKSVAPSLLPGHTVTGLSMVHPIRRAEMMANAGLEQHEVYTEIAHIVAWGENRGLVAFGSEKLLPLLHSEGSPTILGGEVNSENYGMSGAIRQVSAEIGMVPYDDPEALKDAACVPLTFMRGDQFVVEAADGSVAIYQIASYD